MATRQFPELEILGSIPRLIVMFEGRKTDNSRFASLIDRSTKCTVR